AGYLDKSDGKLSAWMARQQEDRRLLHGLFSAWYLHRHCASNQPCDPEVTSMAVRAILLHDCLSAPIDAQRDPVAALLVLGNEVWEWDPWTQVAPSDRGRSLHKMGTSVAAHEPQDYLIRLRGMRFKAADGGLVACLPLPSAPRETWPTIAVTLQI